MIISELLQSIESSKVFKSWRKTNPTPYLVHFLKIIETTPTNESLSLSTSLHPGTSPQNT